MRHGVTSYTLRPVGFAYPSRWRGLRLAVAGAVLLALAAPGVGRTAEEQGNRAEEQALAALPQKVQVALERAARVYEQPLRGARWLAVHRLSGTEHPLYQVRGTNARGHKIELEVTSAGRVIEVEEHGIPLSEVPSAVTEALKARMPDFSPTWVEAIFQAENPRPVCYGFEGEDQVGMKIEIYISADGKTFLN